MAASHVETIFSFLALPHQKHVMDSSLLNAMKNAVVMDDSRVREPRGSFIGHTPTFAHVRPA